MTLFTELATKHDYARAQFDRGLDRSQRGVLGCAVGNEENISGFQLEVLVFSFEEPFEVQRDFCSLAAFARGTQYFRTSDRRRVAESSG